MDIVSLWHDQIPRDRLDPQRFLDDVVRAGATCDQLPLCMHRRPHFVSSALVSTLRNALKYFHRTLRALTQVLQTDGLDGRPDSLAVRLGLPKELIELASIDPGYEGDPLVTRVDCLVHDGHPMVVGLECDAPTGLATSDALSRMFEQDPLMASFPGLIGYRGVADVAQCAVDAWKQWGGEQLEPYTVIVIGGNQALGEHALLRRLFKARGMRCEVARPEALTLSGGRLHLAGEPVDMVFRAFRAQELLQRPDDFHALVTAYRRRQVCVVNSFRSALLTTNAVFAMLHDLEFLRGLPEQQRDMVRHHVPWTGLLSAQDSGPRSEQLMALAIAHRSELVLKPVNPGRGPVIGGWSVSQDDWEVLIEEANHHVIQRRVPEEHESFPNARDRFKLQERGVHLSPFLVRGRMAGLACTLSQPGEPDSHVPVFAVP